MREYVTILRGILSGERVTFEGEIFSVRGFQLAMAPPEHPARIYMSAIGPQMCRLAGELADGVIGYCYSVPYLRDVVLPNLAIGAERAGRTLDDFDVACGFPTIVAPDDGGGRADRAGQVMMFATATASSKGYAQSFAAAGYATSCEIQERVAAARRRRRSRGSPRTRRSMRSRRGVARQGAPARSPSYEAAGLTTVASTRRRRMSGSRCTRGTSRTQRCADPRVLVPRLPRQ